MKVLRRTLRLTWQASPWITLLVAVLVAFQSVAVALLALSQRWLVDAAGLGTVGGLLAAGALGAVAYTASTAGRTVLHSLILELVLRVDILVNDEILGLVAGLPGVAHLEHPEHLDRIFLLRRGSRTLAQLALGLSATAAGVISIALSVGLLVAVDPRLALLAPLALLPLWINSRTLRRLRDAEKEAARHGRLEEMLHRMCTDAGTAKELRVSGASAAIDEEAAKAWDRYATLISRARVRASSWNAFGWICFSAGYLLVLALTADLAARGLATLGDAVLVLVLGARLRGQIQEVVEQIGRVIQTGQVTEHYTWLHEYAAAHGPTGDKHPVSGGITFESVTFAYPGSKAPVLRDVSFHLRRGSVVALVGVNGAGKTTLVKLLTGMYQPASGTIKVDGQNLAATDLTAWRQRTTAAFQDFVKFQLPVRHAVGIGSLPRMDQVDEAIHAAGADFVERLPNGVDTQLGFLFDGVDLSQGQWQRLALARALMREKPEVLILDEPTAALDPASEHDLYERFTTTTRTAGEGITVLVSHRFSTVRMADHIIVVADGTIAEQGSHEELMARNGPYAQLFRFQAAAYSADNC
ncbi:ABC transporter ATP-binding protein [Nonomuraea sp. SYSU D8015]|uniref:ABC transporter ATP-binding protein n=1 Tax=Nonomuraea sp. SYSU D8015 TaxID=2593644 RepID=UPI0016611BB5|nr:ABC transporter ATP-binding protein [Nonomuraea sp. SYSU D8015]